jgi:two-component system, OmpR family, sensor histidine kinase SenX3
MTNNRTSRYLILPFAIGLLALLVGLGFLSRMIVEERRDARSSTLRESAALAQVARQEWLGFFRNTMSATNDRIARTRSNPLSPCEGCYLREGDVQRIPSVHGAALPTATIQMYITELNAQRASTNVTDASDSQWMFRRQIHARCNGTTSSPADAWLEHQGKVALLARQEIASQLVLLEQCDVGRALSVPLLRDGLQMPGGRFIDGLQVAVLRASGKLSADELRFVAQRIGEISHARDVADADFQRAAASIGARPIAALSAQTPPANPLIVGTATPQWFVESTANGIHGFAFATNDVLAQIAKTMREKGILQTNESIAASFPNAPLQPEQVLISVVSPRFVAANLRQDRRTAWKLGLVTLCGVLALMVAGFGATLQLRRRKHLEMQGRMLGQVAHEFRTPLASMRAIAETIERRTQAMPEVRDYPARLLRDIDGMTFLVQNTLSFNRLTKGNWQLNVAPVAIAELVQAAVDDARELSSKQVQLMLPTATSSVSGDPELLRLLVRNLVVNAIAYNRNEIVIISIETKLRSSGCIDLLITDNGIGIDRSETKSIFQEYVRGQAGSMARGSGLGLALCQTIMHAHGGQVVVSRSDATGTTFAVMFS